MGVYEKKNGVYVRTDGGLIQKPVYTASEVGAVPSPAVAEVGQVMMVSEVDANGRPITWEPYSEGEYELIETITLEEDTSEIVITQEPNGNPYNFKKVRILTKILASNEDGGIINITVGRTNIGYVLTISGAVAKKDKYGQATARIENGIIDGLTCVAASSQSDIVNLYGPAYRRIGAAAKTIDYLSLKSTVVMPAGSEIKIYGVRA